MIASPGHYPSLGRYFRTISELAAAGCMSKTRVRDCLDGKKTFTRAEEKAISANIILKLMNSPSYDHRELEEVNIAWKGKFDEIFRDTTTES